MTTGTAREAIATGDKLTELLLYLCERRITQPAFGHTALNTLVCMCDMLYYRRWGGAISGAEYVCGEHGPWLAGYQERLDELVDAGRVTIQPTELGGYPHERPMALDAANLFGFNGAEIAAVEQVLRATEGETASGLSDLANHLTKWRNGSPGEPLPYEWASEE